MAHGAGTTPTWTYTTEQLAAFAALRQNEAFLHLQRKHPVEWWCHGMTGAADVPLNELHPDLQDMLAFVDESIEDIEEAMLDAALALHANCAEDAYSRDQAAACHAEETGMCMDDYEAANDDDPTFEENHAAVGQLLALAGNTPGADEARHLHRGHQLELLDAANIKDACAAVKAEYHTVTSKTQLATDIASLLATDDAGEVDATDPASTLTEGQLTKLCGFVPAEGQNSRCTICRRDFKFCILADKNIHRHARSKAHQAALATLLRDNPTDPYGVAANGDPGTLHNKLDSSAKKASNSNPKTTPANPDSSLTKNSYSSKTGQTNVINGNDKDSNDGDDAKPLVLRSRDPNVLPPSASRKLDLSPLVDAALAKRNVPSESRSKRKKKGGRSRRRR